jgi:hypothetical protein
MAEISNIHWTDDNILLERFVMHQLSSDADNQLSAHLAVCKKCRQAVKEESRIVAGVQLAGRTEMKQRLNSYLATSRQDWSSSAGRMDSFHKIPWIRIVSVAAAAVIIIAVGVNNNWFNLNYHDNPVVEEKRAQDQPQQALAPTRESSESKETAAEPLDTKLARSNDLRRENRSEGLKEKDIRHKSDLKEEAAKTMAATPSGGVEAGAVSLGKRGDTDNKSHLSGQLASAPPREFWLEGHVVASSSPHDGQQQSASEPQEYQSRAFRSKDLAKNETKERAISSARNLPNPISLSQKPLSSLPATLQASKRPSGRIPTLIENREDTIHMTLYLDSPVPDSEMRSSNIQMIGPDSLILNLSSQRISFKLPPVLRSR